MNLSFILQSIAEAKGDRYYGLVETWGSREGQYLEKCVEWSKPSNGAFFAKLAIPHLLSPDLPLLLHLTGGSPLFLRETSHLVVGLWPSLVLPRKGITQ